VALNRRTDAHTEEDLPRSDVSVVDLPKDLTVREAIQRYEASPDVEYAEPDFLLEPTAYPNDPYFPRLYGLDNTGQTGGITDADTDGLETWNTSTGSPTTVVAVIDVGVDVNHPDLRDNIWVSTDELAGNGVDDDRNGYVDDRNGYDFANDDASVYDPDPLNGAGDEHGTHVAGTIAAQGNNGTGVTGVSWEASIMVAKFLGPHGGYTSDAVEALNYAVANGAKISNNSWGGGGYSRALHDAIVRADAAGHLFLAAAGNDGVDNDATPSYPASYGIPNVVSVAATDDRDALASFSNFGASSVDLAAPGVNIVSTLPGNRYGSYSGTSMATPHVTGVAALIKSEDPTQDDAQIKARILTYVEKKPSLEGKTVTGGRLNAEASISQTTPLDDIKPAVTSPRPASGATSRDRTPTIGAVVSDDRTELAKSNIRLYLDGRSSNFNYEAGSNRLSYTTRALSYAWHTVKIVAEDAAGNSVIRSWRFKVIA
jgi:subtilisin family serine protease